MNVSCNHQTYQTLWSCSPYSLGQTGPPLYGVLCPDWVRWAGIPENVFYSMSRRRITEQTLHNSEWCWNPELFDMYLNKIKKNMRKQLLIMMFSDTPTQWYQMNLVTCLQHFSLILLQSVLTTSLWDSRPDQWIQTRSPAPTRNNTPAGSPHGSQAGPGSTVRASGRYKPTCQRIISSKQTICCMFFSRALVMNPEICLNLTRKMLLLPSVVDCSVSVKKTLINKRLGCCHLWGTILEKSAPWENVT